MAVSFFGDKQIRRRSVVMVCFVLLGLLSFRCRRALTEYDLDQHSYWGGILSEIQGETGLKLPAHTIGLNYHYKPPIDPIVFARLDIPESEEKLVRERIVSLPGSDFSVPQNFANDICPWWPARFNQVLIKRRIFYDYYYKEFYLLHENDRLVLYLKYFTI